jgi:hypothetical protein
MEQRVLMDQEFRVLAEANETFLELVSGSEPLRADELRRLVEKRPSLWGRYASWVEKMPLTSLDVC